MVMIEFWLVSLHPPLLYTYTLVNQFSNSKSYASVSSHNSSLIFDTLQPLISQFKHTRHKTEDERETNSTCTGCVA
jgi:hypothetical protein